MTDTSKQLGDLRREIGRRVAEFLRKQNASAYVIDGARAVCEEAMLPEAEPEPRTCGNCAKGLSGVCGKSNLPVADEEPGCEDWEAIW
jgi:hypothetical protein